MECKDCAEFPDCSRWHKSVAADRDTCIFNPSRWHQTVSDLELIKATGEAITKFILSDPPRLTEMSFPAPLEEHMQVIVLDDHAYKHDANVLIAYRFGICSWSITPLSNLLRMYVHRMQDRGHHVKLSEAI